MYRSTDNIPVSNIDIIHEPILQDLPIIDFLMVMLLLNDVESPIKQSLPI